MILITTMLFLMAGTAVLVVVALRALDTAVGRIGGVGFRGVDDAIGELDASLDAMRGRSRSFLEERHERPCST